MSLSETKSSPVRPSPMRRWLAALDLTSKFADQPQRTFPVVLDELALRFGDAPALLSDTESLSFAGLAARARRYARWALDEGLEPGDCVALLMPNRPDYVAAWTGLSRVGCVVALLNTNLAGAALAHCVAVARPRHIIVDAVLAETYASALPHLGDSPRVWQHGAGGSVPDAARIDLALDRADPAPLRESERRPVSIVDPALYIYTSGTTGLPKAARVSHRRILSWSFWFAGLIGPTPDDRMYDCLPLYHSVGGIVAIGSTLVGGGSVVIAEKFSASRFWDEIRRWDCTLFQYIGELCRYLVAAPPVPGDHHHRLRLVCGNGLRGDVWPGFQARFAIPQVLEFYAATEGNFSLFNVEGQPGAIGRIPPFLAHRFPAAIVRFDPDRGAPLRGADGLCVRCARNEPGEAIGFISDGRSQHGGNFEGYTDPGETERKVLRDVFEPGDAWFRTGDLMRIDARGFYYFVDRVGDTFRWKGENVATSEVAAALLSCPGVSEANVYGVAVPGADGKAGMAAIITGEAFSLAGLRAHLTEHLPAYARPLFLRLQREIAVTETFKHKKDVLARQGFDPGGIDDPLFFDDARARAYVALDAALYAGLATGGVRV